MAQEVDISKDFREFCNQIKFDLHHINSKNRLLNWRMLDDILILKNQFFYINDFTKACNAYVHPNIEFVTGYPPNQFTDMGRIYQLMHPDDREQVYDFSKITITLSKDFKKELKENPDLFTFLVDFRLKRKDERIIRLSRQTCCFKTDEEGNMVYALVVYTDITHLKTSNKISFSWIGDSQIDSYFNDLICKHNIDCSFTNREKDVLTLLAEGESATQIAEKLFLSVHTIISHRKHLLEKVGAKNTAELIRIAMEKGWV